jgi:hypothetical protein
VEGGVSEYWYVPLALLRITLYLTCKHYVICHYYLACNCCIISMLFELADPLPKFLFFLKTSYDSLLKPWALLWCIENRQVASMWFSFVLDFFSHRWEQTIEFAEWILQQYMDVLLIKLNYSFTPIVSSAWSPMNCLLLNIFFLCEGCWPTSLLNSQQKHISVLNKTSSHGGHLDGLSNLYKLTFSVLSMRII